MAKNKKACASSYLNGSGSGENSGGEASSEHSEQKSRMTTGQGTLLDVFSFPLINSLLFDEESDSGYSRGALK